MLYCTVFRKGGGVDTRLSRLNRLPAYLYASRWIAFVLWCKWERLGQGLSGCICAVPLRPAPAVPTAVLYYLHHDMPLFVWFKDELKKPAKVIFHLSLTRACAHNRWFHVDGQHLLRPSPATYLLFAFDVSPLACGPGSLASQTTWHAPTRSDGDGWRRVPTAVFPQFCTPS